ncbi:hypothetical protein G4Z16_06135 [Streptomyces bathyalis]|uniref:Uncharacterized protein n=1 Tax=Streptomyces bathyalis TaxID=2710756 RepID=A0A7T1T479_9ACTN|nr:hypothetical protein [Streptomyces bathyalis]QPP06046.1 hypothetical protein G4Z16_06135 [Streptomyces bathyalis]
MILIIHIVTLERQRTHDGDPAYPRVPASAADERAPVELVDLAAVLFTDRGLGLAAVGLIKCHATWRPKAHGAYRSGATSAAASALWGATRDTAAVPAMNTATSQGSPSA